MKKRIKQLRAYAQFKIELFRRAEAISLRHGYPVKAEHYALERDSFEQLLACLDEMESVAA